MTEPRCRICGVGFKTGTQYFPELLLPGDIPDPDEVCGDCRRLSVEWAEAKMAADELTADTEKLGL